MNIETHSILKDESLPESFKIARDLEGLDDPDLIRKNLRVLFETIPDELHVELTNNINPLYAGMQSENCLARVDRLSRVLEALELKKPLVIAEDTDSHYANAVVPVQEGIKLAFAEGQAPGPVRTMVGFGKTIIGFKTDDLEVAGVDFSKDDMRNTGERKYLCRHVIGNLNPDDIRYLIMRIPYQYMPEEHMTDSEKTSRGAFVFRGVKF
jgi:hypothetical protein